jgi:hypothetical protein
MIFQLQYWNERDAEWLGAGYRSHDRAEVMRRMHGASEQCNRCVRFRVLELPVQ